MQSLVRSSAKAVMWTSGRLTVSFEPAAELPACSAGQSCQAQPYNEGFLASMQTRRCVDVASMWLLKALLNTEFLVGHRSTSLDTEKFEK